MWTVKTDPDTGAYSWHYPIGNGWTALVISINVRDGYIYDSSTYCDHCTGSDQLTHAELADAKNRALSLALVQPACEGMGSNGEGHCAMAAVLLTASPAPVQSDWGV
jgi:hypothetical protein